MKDKKQLLRDALEKERGFLASKGKDTLDHELAMYYLETGEIGTSGNLYDFEILQACVEDIEMLFNDYDIN